MNPAAAARIRESFLGFAPRLDALVEDFYVRLFAGRPAIRAMFPQDMTRQRVQMAASLALIFRNLDCLDVLERPLMELGAAHARWGVKPEHYLLVRDVLLEAIAHAAHPVWGHQLREDWRDGLGRVAALMLKGAAAAATEPMPEVVTRPNWPAAGVRPERTDRSS